MSKRWRLLFVLITVMSLSWTSCVSIRLSFFFRPNCERQFWPSIYKVLGRPHFLSHSSQSITFSKSKSGNSTTMQFKAFIIVLALAGLSQAISIRSSSPNAIAAGNLFQRGCDSHYCCPECPAASCKSGYWFPNCDRSPCHCCKESDGSDCYVPAHGS